MSVEKKLQSVIFQPQNYNDDYDTGSEDSGFNTNEDDLNEETVMKTMRNEGLL